ncbi:MAG: hypothetical protein ACKVS5_04180 [Parvularculaceae bacterium]
MGRLNQYNDRGVRIQAAKLRNIVGFKKIYQLAECRGQNVRQQRKGAHSKPSLRFSEGGPIRNKGSRAGAALGYHALGYQLGDVCKAGLKSFAKARFDVLARPLFGVGHDRQSYD